MIRTTAKRTRPKQDRRLARTKGYMNRNTDHDPRISEIFYYFESHTDIKNGRTVGRKIGVIQEILVKKLLLQDQAVRDCLIYEPRLRGRSGATHKVEFVFFSPIVVAAVPIGKVIRVAEPSLQLRVKSTDVGKGRARISALVGAKDTAKTLAVEQAFPIEVVQHGQPRTLYIKLTGITPDSARLSVLDGSLPVASIESKRVGAQRFANTDQLGSGIQTIEKAKQASLVAIDFDLKYNPSLLASDGSKEDRPFRSFVVLGNGVHWTDHDLSVLSTYVDFTFLAKDDAIIRYAEYVRKKADTEGESFFNYFMSYFEGMTKTEADTFAVAASDFRLMRGVRKGDDLLKAVRAQLPKYIVAKP